MTVMVSPSTDETGIHCFDGVLPSWMVLGADIFLLSQPLMANMPQWGLSVTVKGKVI
jgi:hypothetical protein